jgi:hypothetical protein
MRIEQLEERALDELGLDIEALVADYGPDQLIPFTGEVAEGEEAPEPVPFDREDQTKRLRTAERALAQLGRINPLALEEFSALEERHKFLTEQLEDLRGTRRDLLDIVREVDQRVEQVFTEAYADVATAFEAVFTRLFPGGEGRLVLTDPDDMLSTVNFDTTALALSFEGLGLAMAHVAATTVFRILKLMSPTYSDLPRFLTRHGGSRTGFATVQKTASALEAEIRHLALPLGAMTAPVADGAEDYAPMTPRVPGTLSRRTVDTSHTV